MVMQLAGFAANNNYVGLQYSASKVLFAGKSNPGLINQAPFDDIECIDSDGI